MEEGIRKVGVCIILQSDDTCFCLKLFIVIKKCIFNNNYEHANLATKAFQTFPDELSKVWN